jgi:hypothetical protein
VEWATLTVVYLIDPELAPSLVKAVIDHLNDLNEPEAEKELMTLMRYLGVEPVI